MPGAGIFIMAVCVGVALVRSISGDYATGWIVAAAIITSWVVNRYNTKM